MFFDFKGNNIIIYTELFLTIVIVSYFKLLIWKVLTIIKIHLGNFLVKLILQFSFCIYHYNLSLLTIYKILFGFFTGTKIYI